MSRVDELIKALAPNGIRHAALSDIATTVGGLTGKTKADFSGGTVRYVSYKNVYANVVVDLLAPDFVVVGPKERQNSLRLGDILFTGSSENLQDVGMSSVIVAEPSEPLYLNSFCFALRLDEPTLLLPEFSKYLFRAESVRRQIRQAASGVTRINISKQRFMKTRIPVPPIEVQRAIVAVLDSFSQLSTDLQDVLKAELAARRVQYVYYREKLLTCSPQVRRARIDEVLNLRAGKFIAAGDIQPKQSSQYRYPCYGGNGLRGYVAVFNQEGRHVLIGRQGALSGNTKRVDGRFYATEHAVVVDVSAEVNVDWAFHLLTAMDLNQYASKGAQPGLAVRTLNALQITVPPLAEQKQAASILDRLDTLVSDLEVSLPAEISGRRAQYHYYSDRLLTFKESAA